MAAKKKKPTQTTTKQLLAAFQEGQYTQAESIARAMLKAEPEHVDAMHILALVHKQRGEFGAAQACFEQLLTRHGQHDFAVVLRHNYGNLLRDAGLPALAEQQYRAALAQQEDYPDAWNSLGNLYNTMGEPSRAVPYFERAIELNPAQADAWNNLGGALHKLGRLAEAKTHFEQALTLRPDYAVAHYNLGNLLVDVGQHAEGLAELERAIAADPSYIEAYSSLLRQKQACCDWQGLDALSGRIREIVARGGRGKVFPFAFLSLPTTMAEQQQCAEQWATHQYGYLEKLRPSLGFGPSPAHPRLRIGYLSSDLHEHATAYLMAEVFELHDRNRFEVFAYSTGPDDASPMRQRLMRAFEHFVDLRQASPVEIAQRIHHDQIDILVDLKGYTRDTRSGVLAMRPAPIQVNYLGYPGTMGADFVDYVLTDPFVSPPETAEHYNEQFAYVPCYQCNDRQRPHPAKPDRASQGLPEEAVVLCCFNHTYKITPEFFKIWCEVLAGHPETVMWLLKSNPLAEANLKEAARRNGVDTTRLIFADPRPLPEHLARLQCADLFLDTRHYNAHTTASDALWSGVPVVTLAGDTFASRVAGSLLQAVGLPQLISCTPEDYKRRIETLVGDGEQRQALKRHLENIHASAPLFDSPRFTSRLEMLYQAMWQRHQAGLPPAAMQVGPT